MNDKAVRDAAAKVDNAVERRESARSRLTSALEEDGRAAAFLANANAELEQAVRVAAKELDDDEKAEAALTAAPFQAPFDPSTHFEAAPVAPDDTPF